MKTTTTVFASPPQAEEAISIIARVHFGLKQPVTLASGESLQGEPFRMNPAWASPDGFLLWR
ncbi:MAG: hypothetical protein HYX79_04545 [Chloroflexi bacterium]|nr:hypothetical protein [Chloroflexota bacterium]